MRATCQRIAGAVAASLLASAIGAETGRDPRLQDADGLLVEDPRDAGSDPDYFNADNRIYLPGREFIYSYSVRRYGRELLVRATERDDPATKNWTLVDSADADGLTIRYVGFRELEGRGGLDDLFPGYGQTVVQQRYLDSGLSLLFDGSTGLVENSANVWLHPFRGQYFSVTQLSPIPIFRRATAPD